MSFQDSPLGYSQFTGQDDLVYEGCSTDTLPDKEGIKMKDFDKPEFELDKTLGKVDAELKNLDFTKLQKDATELALKDIDIDKIMKNVELALKNVDMEKILASVNSSLKSMNLDYKSAEIEKQWPRLPKNPRKQRWS